MSQSFPRRQAAAAAQSSKRSVSGASIVRGILALGTASVLFLTALQATQVIAWPLWAILLPWFLAVLFLGLILVAGIAVAANAAAQARA